MVPDKSLSVHNTTDIRYEIEKVARVSDHHNQSANHLENYMRGRLHLVYAPSVGGRFEVLMYRTALI
jgi:hypothetical protein